MLHNYILVRTNRRTLSIKIKNKQVYVYAPLFVSNETINRFVMQHQAWIDKKLSKETINVNISFDNSDIYILGKKYKLLVQTDKKDDVKIIDDSLIVRGKNEKAVKNNLVYFLKNIIEQNVLHIKEKTNADFSIEYKFYKSRWGCCYPQRKLIILNLYCACLPQQLIEAVIYHEIAHLTVASHNAKFYAVLNKMCPEYKKLSAELKKYSL